MGLTLNIILTQQEQDILKKCLLIEEKLKNLVIVLSLLHIGLMQIIRQ